MDCLPPTKTITGPYYAQLVFKLVEVTVCCQRETLREVVTWECFFLITMHQGAESVVAHQALRDCRFIQLNHPAYSPDLGPSDYFVFRNPKFHLRGTRFTDVESLKVTVEAWFDRQNGKILFLHLNSVEEK